MNSMSDGSINEDLKLPDINQKKTLINSRSDPLLRGNMSEFRTNRSDDNTDLEKIEDRSKLNFQIKGSNQQSKSKLSQMKSSQISNAQRMSQA